MIELLFLEANEPRMIEIVLPAVIMIVGFIVMWQVHGLARRRGNPKGRSLWNLLAPGPWSEKELRRYHSLHGAPAEPQTPTKTKLGRKERALLILLAAVGIPFFVSCAVAGVLYQSRLAFAFLGLGLVVALANIYIRSYRDPSWFRRGRDGE